MAAILRSIDSDYAQNRVYNPVPIQGNLRRWDNYPGDRPPLAASKRVADLAQKGDEYIARSVA
jgi:hypothetical protein